MTDTTEIYFVRHCQPDTSGGYNPAFPLTEQGTADTKLVTETLAGRGITAVYSSDYIRAVKTVESFAESEGLAIRTDPRLRERTAGDWKSGFPSYAEYIYRQIDDFSLKAAGGESMAEVQKRCMSAVKDILAENRGKTAAAALHGMALASVLKYYYPRFGSRDFEKMINLMPMILKLTFEGDDCADFSLELAVKRIYPNNYI